MVAIAMRFADDGHHRDVLFGVLLGRDCDAELAARIADSVWALQEARRSPKPATEVSDAQPAPAPEDAASKIDESAVPRRAFESFWQGLFGLRP
jgi:hypothetical protein